MFRVALFFAFYLQVFIGHAHGVSNGLEAYENRLTDKKWRQKIGTFRIGIVTADRDEWEIRRMEPFRLAVQEALDVKVELFSSPNYRSLLDAHTSGRIDYAVYSASSYAAAWLSCKCIQPIAAPVSHDEKTGIHAVLFNKAGTNVTREDVTKRPLIVKNRSSFSGYLLARYELELQGLDLTSSEDLLVESGSHLASRVMMESRPRSLMLGWEYGVSDAFEHSKYPDSETLAGENIDQNLNAIWRSSLLRFGPHAVRTSLDKRAKEILQKLLVSLHRDYPKAQDVFDGGIYKRFIPVAHTEYANVTGLIESLKQRRRTLRLKVAASLRR